MKRAIFRRAVVRVQAVHTIDQRLFHKVVVGQSLAGRIAMVAEQHKAQHRIAIAEIMPLHPLEQLGHIGDAGEQHRHHHRRRAILGNGPREIELGQ